MSRPRRLLLSLLVIGAAALAIGGITFAGFAQTTGSPNNSFAAGTVAIGDNDAGSAMFTVPSLAPGETRSRCVRITSTGSLGSGVRLYGAPSGALAPYLTLTVTRGADSAPSFPSCTGFSPDANNYIGAGPGVLYSGPLSSYPTGWAAAIVDPDPTWSSGTARSYRFAITLSNDPAGQGKSASASFTWEARSQ